MKVVFLKIENFRGIKSANLEFDGHTLLVGQNNVGKSSVCEALDLLIGPDRLSRSSPIDEYDFYNAQYLDDDGEAIPIIIEGILIELSIEAQSNFSRNLEFWHIEEKRVIGKGEIAETDSDKVVPCLRLLFRGVYDPDEDEFSAKTFYSHSPDEEEDGVLTEVYRTSKREIGFLYLRALRTGSRALSLEKGSLLDVLLTVGKKHPHLWEDTRKTLLSLDPPIDNSIGELRSVLDNIEARIKQYIPIETAGHPTRLFVSQLTREHLRKTLSFFMSTAKDQAPIPFQGLGTGTLSTLVFALLSAIAELKDNVIFAMEEPEIAIPPHTQRRIVNYLLGHTSQSFITSHSPYVIERFKPEQIKIMRRDADAKIKITSVTFSSGIKPKLFQRKLRHSIAEAMLGRAVIVGEGLTEQQVLFAVAEIMESTDARNYPLDLSGITIFNADGDGNLSDYGAFFGSLGLKTFAFYDKKDRSANEILAIQQSFDVYNETQYPGMEQLLAKEIPVNVLWSYLKSISLSITLPDVQPVDSEVQRIARDVLKDKKGESRASDLISNCSIQELPQSIVDFFRQIYDQYPEPDSFDLSGIGEQEPGASDATSIPSH